MVSTLKDPEFGEITLSQNRRLKRISLSVRPPGKIRLSFPSYVRLSEAVGFLESRRAWVRGALEKYAAASEVTSQPIGMPFSTRRHSLLLDPQYTDKMSAKISDGIIKVTYPLSEHYTEPRVQSAIKEAIEEAWRIEAKEMLLPRLAELADRHGFVYRKAAIRNTLTRWGSCSSSDDISLSLHLMRLPDHLSDYIMLHELCHTVHKNHGPHFHLLLDKVTTGHHLELSRELKSYSPRW